MGGTHRLGRYAPGTLTLWRFYSLSWPDGDPTVLTLSTDGSSYSAWFTLANSNGVGYFTTRLNGSLSIPPMIVALPTANAKPWGITVDSEGHVWIAESGANKIAVWFPPYFFGVYLPFVSR